MTRRSQLVRRTFGRSRTPIIASFVWARNFDAVQRLIGRGPVLISYRRQVNFVLMLPQDYHALAGASPGSLPKARLRRYLSLQRDLARRRRADGK